MKIVHPNSFNSLDFNADRGQQLSCAKNEMGFKGIGNAASNALDKSLNDVMKWGQPTYATRHERFWTRLVSGFTAGGFMSMDYANKARRQGKSENIVKKDRNQRLAQETITTLGEAAGTLALLTIFSKAANTRVGVAACITAGVGFAFNIISRLALGRRITPMPFPEKPSTSPPVFRKFEEILNQSEQDAGNRKPLLSLKNILIAFGVLAAGGFALRAGKKAVFRSDEGLNAVKTKILESMPFGKKISASIEPEKIIVDDTFIDNLALSLKEVGEEALGKKVKKTALEYLAETGKAEITIEKEKTVHLLGNRLEVPVKKLWEIPLAPFQLVRDILAFPYKVVSMSAGAIQELVQKPNSKLEKLTIKDIENILVKYDEFATKHQDKTEQEFIKAFGEYVQKMRKVSVDDKNFSKIANAGIATWVIILGSLSGIPFQVFDEYNKTIENGGTKAQAQKEGRKRGVNRFIRMLAQTIIVHNLLNKIFAKQYNSSLLYAGIITFTATVLTDIVSRMLTNMSIISASKEQQIKKEKGFVGNYNKMIDYLTD